MESYLEIVLKTFDLTEEQFFSETRDREILHARHLFYYLCVTRKIRGVAVVQYMLDNGADVQSSYVTYGKDATEKRIEEDEDYYIVVNRIKDQVTI